MLVIHVGLSQFLVWQDIECCRLRHKCTDLDPIGFTDRWALTVLRVHFYYVRAQWYDLCRSCCHVVMTVIRRFVIKVLLSESQLFSMLATHAFNCMRPERWWALTLSLEKPATLACHSTVGGRVSLRGQSAYWSHWHYWDISVICKSLVIGLDSIIVAPNDVLAAGFTVGGIEEAWVKFEHFPKVFDSLLIILLLFCQFCSSVEWNSVLVVRLNLDADLSLHFIDFACRQKSVILGSSLPVRWNLARIVIRVGIQHNTVVLDTAASALARACARLCDCR